MSSFARANPIEEVKRFDKKGNKIVQISRPDIVGRYNASMGGVDLADQLLSLYRINIRSKKYYYNKIIFHMFDMAVVNAWLLYRRDASHMNLRRKDILALAEFKIQIAFGLIKSGKPLGQIKRGRPSSSSPIEHAKNRRYQSPDKSIRFDDVGHCFIYVFICYNCEGK